jgi:hypothetical protein
VKIGRTDNHQQKPTENQRLSPLLSVCNCSSLSIQQAQNKHSGSAISLQAIFADINIRKKVGQYLASETESKYGSRRET